jgi:hypothetical protein
LREKKRAARIIRRGPFLLWLLNMRAAADENALTRNIFDRIKPKEVVDGDFQF